MENKKMEEKKAITEDELNLVDGGTSIHENADTIARCKKCGSNKIEITKTYSIPNGPRTSIEYVCKDCGYSWIILPNPGPRQ
jgi:DNA-directed RNA polymerase subunit M/transcription elongation factor TFIIS